MISEAQYGRTDDDEGLALDCLQRQAQPATGSGSSFGHPYEATGVRTSKCYTRARLERKRLDG